MTAPIDFPDFAQAVNPPFALTSEAKASGGVSFNVPLPVGTVCVSLGVSSPFALETLTMTGHQTGESYTESSPIGDWVNYPLQWFPIDPADHSVDIDFEASTDTCTLYVGGSMTPVAVALTPGDQIFAELVGANGVTVSTQEYPGYGPNNLGVALMTQNPSPFPWERPMRTASVLGTNGADEAFVPAAPAGQDTWLHWCQLTSGTAAVVATIRGNSSSTVLTGGYPSAANVPILSKDFKGLSLTQAGLTKGEALHLHALSAIYWYATLDYSYG